METAGLLDRAGMKFKMGVAQCKIRLSKFRENLVKIRRGSLVKVKISSGNVVVVPKGFFFFYNKGSSVGVVKPPPVLSSNLQTSCTALDAEVQIGHCHCAWAKFRAPGKKN